MPRRAAPIARPRFGGSVGDTHRTAGHRPRPRAADGDPPPWSTHRPSHAHAAERARARRRRGHPGPPARPDHHQPRRRHVLAGHLHRHRCSTGSRSRPARSTSTPNPDRSPSPSPTWSRATRVTAALTIANDGTAELRYALSTVATNAARRRADPRGPRRSARAAPRSTAPSCSAATALDGAAIGTPPRATTPATATWPPRANEVLCFRVSLPLGSPATRSRAETPPRPSRSTPSRPPTTRNPRFRLHPGPRPTLGPRLRSRSRTQEP